MTKRKTLGCGNAGTSRVASGNTPVVNRISGLARGPAWPFGRGPPPAVFAATQARSGHAPTRSRLPRQATFVQLVVHYRNAGALDRR